ncbi:hydrolase [Thalassotalea sp. LPB0316]|uniref:hydrolase n=1 Tax=Thalassotalea sp. LPB0316 TaxID=2769490 RepID=UPI00186786F9|nr:hydrolase [Thalassotalea sp. LPB0316]QOL26603.1 hydrolase [Thalassotalea sp. LPB0316]
MISASQFKPAWWLPNAHSQTMLAKYFKRHQQISLISEQFPTPDGDFVELAWTSKPAVQSNTPIIVILHGLEGSKDSHYAKGMLQAIAAKGWHGVLMHFRGCGEQQNRFGASYHSGDTKDIHSFSQWLGQTYPLNPKALIGFSLGGNVTVKYLGETNCSPYKAASVICAPLDLASCSKRISSGFSKVYENYLLNMLKNSTIAKVQAKKLPELCVDKIKSLRSIWQFDDYVTGPINGFKNAIDYYQQSSGKQFLAKITKPCLIIHAQDDPFLSHRDIVDIPENLPKNIRFEVSKKGGHVGFISGNNPLKPIFWLEQRIPAFLSEHL